VTRTRLSFGANFTESDVTQEKVVYKLDNLPLKNQRDSFEFQLMVRGGISPMNVFFIDYAPPDSADVRLINNGLRDVREGGQKTIGRDVLYMEMQGSGEIKFTVTSPPLYGHHSAD
jgi:hypothetical protein